MTNIHDLGNDITIHGYPDPHLTASTPSVPSGFKVIEGEAAVMEHADGQYAHCRYCARDLGVWKADSVSELNVGLFVYAHWLRCLRRNQLLLKGTMFDA